jgi:hypothetical protein
MNSSTVHTTYEQHDYSYNVRTVRLFIQRTNSTTVHSTYEQYDSSYNVRTARLFVQRTARLFIQRTNSTTDCSYVVAVEAGVAQETAQYNRKDKQEDILCRFSRAVMIRISLITALHMCFRLTLLKLCHIVLR